MKPEEAIKIIEVAKAECEWNAPLEFQGAFDAAIDALENQMQKPSAQPEPKWIPCSEKLPEDKTAYYLATVANRGLFFTTTVNNNVECVRWDYDRRKGPDSWHWCTERTVIAWMPLPKPWEEGGQK